jgi:hypothetical protein
LRLLWNSVLDVFWYEFKNDNFSLAFIVFHSFWNIEQNVIINNDNKQSIILKTMKASEKLLWFLNSYQNTSNTEFHNNRKYLVEVESRITPKVIKLTIFWSYIFVFRVRICGRKSKIFSSFLYVHTQQFYNWYNIKKID